MFPIDTIFENVRVQTMDPLHPWAYRVGVLGDRIVALDDDLNGVVAKHRVDLGGRYLCPGFNDAHCHLSVLGRNLNEINLSAECVVDLDGLYRAVSHAASSLPLGAWVIGWGFNQLDLGGYPQIDALDRAANGHPVYLEHLSHHVAVVNTEAFRMAGYPEPADMANPSGGEVVRDADGRITGLVREQAARIFKNLITVRSKDSLIEDLRVASQYALERGLTAYTEAGAMRVDTFQTAVETGALRLRTTLMPFFPKLHDLPGFGSGASSDSGSDSNEPLYGLDMGLCTGFGGEAGMLRIGACKIVLDGAFSSMTARLSEPYEKSDERGVLQWDPSDVVEKFCRMHRAGWQIAAHAIGDDAVRLAATAIEEAQRRFSRPDARHRIEHCGLMDDSLVDRILADHIIPVPQGSFIADYGDSYVKVIGMERAMRADRAGAYVRRGAIIPGSTDAPSAHLSPLYAIQGAVTRRTKSGLVLGGKSECLTLDQALYAYTYGSAYASHAERVLGTIVPGKLADFTVLESDPHLVAPDEIKTIGVAATIVGGRMEFERL